MAQVTDDTQKKQIGSVQKEVAMVVKSASEALTIKSAKDLDAALAVLKEIGEKKKLFKEKITEGIVAPIKLGLKNLLAFVDPVEEMLLTAEKQVKFAINEYRAKAAAALEAAEKKAEAQVATGEKTVAQAAVTVEKKAAVVEKIPTRINTVVTVEDATKVPDEFWVIDMVLLRRRALDAHKNGVAIPGVKVTTEEVIVNR